MATKKTGKAMKKGKKLSGNKLQKRTLQSSQFTNTQFSRDTGASSDN